MGEPMRPLGRDRWTFRYSSGPYHDNLVHMVLAAHGSSYEQRDVHVYPTDGITECGVYVNLLSGTLGACRQGFYVSDDQFLSCMRCASGVCTDGISFRQTQKESRVAQVYGSTLNSSKPNMQNIPRRVLDEAYSLTSEEVAKLFDEWLRRNPGLDKLLKTYEKP
jgi:hypothetical protein